MNKHQTPDSSNIREYGYDPEKRELHVTFKSGGTYVYSGVEPEHYDGMRAADSHGSYIHEHIKGSYNHRRV